MEDKLSEKINNINVQLNDLRSKPREKHHKVIDTALIDCYRDANAVVKDLSGTVNVMLLSVGSN